MIGNRPLVFACGWGRTIWGIKWFSGEKLLQERGEGGGGELVVAKRVQRRKIDCQLRGIVRKLQSLRGDQVNVIVTKPKFPPPRRYIIIGLKFIFV